MKTEKLKIGILTFHCAHNYGAVLQTYGLQEYLKSCGHEVEIIDYRPDYLTRGYNAFPMPVLRGVSLKRKILRLGWWGLHLPFTVPLIPIKLIRRKKFEDFISGKLNLSQGRFSSGCKVSEKYDAIVFGSDQVWSPAHTNGGDPIILGNFPTPASTLKIAYAASAGAASATLGDNLFFTENLKNFDSISVREENLAKSLQPKTDLKIETVLDPTLLADRNAWEKLAVEPKIKKKYVLVYQVSYNVEADKVARDLAEQLGAEVVSIWAGYTSRYLGTSMVESPAQFVGLFKNAACVVSTSFHGTAFSIIFERPFYYVGNGNAGENRPRQIMEKLGLMNRFIKEGDRPVVAPNPHKIAESAGGGICCRKWTRQSIGGRFLRDYASSENRRRTSCSAHFRSGKFRSVSSESKHDKVIQSSSSPLRHGGLFCAFCVGASVL